MALRIKYAFFLTELLASLRNLSCSSGSENAKDSTYTRQQGFILSQTTNHISGMLSDGLYHIEVPRDAYSAVDLGMVGRIHGDSIEVETRSGNVEGS